MKRRCSSRTDASRMSWPSWRISVALAPFVEIEDHALAQRAARGLQRLDVEMRGQRVEDREGRRRSPRGGLPSARAALASRRFRPPGTAPSASAGRPA
jgi:hypothetical protein